MWLPFNTLLRIVFLVVLLCCLVVLVLHSDGLGSVARSTGDFVAFWAGANAVVSGCNPYDINILREAVQQALPGSPMPAEIYNPPWLFSVIFWFGYFKATSVGLFWVFLTASGVVFSAVFMARLLMCLSQVNDPNAVRRLSLWSAVLLVTFFPFSITIYLGQLSWILLFCVTLAFPLLERSTSAVASIAAGMLLSITLIKPHLVFLLLAAVGVKGLKSRRIWLVIGGAIGFAVLALFPLVLYSDIYQAYFSRSVLDPFKWETPTFSYYLAKFWGAQIWILRITPAAIGLILTSIWAWRDERENLSPAAYVWLLLLSILCTPYLWTYDFVLLFPFILWTLIVDSAVPFRKLGENGIPLLLLLCNLFLYVGPRNMMTHVWYPSVIALIGLSQIIWYKRDATLYPQSCP